jgi:hypothetical protein
MSRGWQVLSLPTIQNVRIIKMGDCTNFFGGRQQLFRRFESVGNAAFLTDFRQSIGKKYIFHTCRPPKPLPLVISAIRDLEL